MRVVATLQAPQSHNVLDGADPINPEMISATQVRLARMAINELCWIDTQSIHSVSLLAERLYGVSRAISALVMAFGVPGNDRQLALSETFPHALRFRAYNGYVLQCPPFQTIHYRTRQFTAVSGFDDGALLRMDQLCGVGRAPKYGIVVPTDAHLETLASEDFCFWEMPGFNAYDSRCGLWNIEPFGNSLYGDNTPRSYFSLLQELGAELLATTEQKR